MLLNLLECIWIFFINILSIVDVYIFLNYNGKILKYLSFFVENFCNETYFILCWHNFFANKLLGFFRGQIAILDWRFYDFLFGIYKFMEEL